ncbi:MAG: hypothetical protein WCX95_03915 [Candidatus Gracilibacteria bacterium]
MMRGFDGGLMFVFGLHGLFMVVVLVALIFLVMWANKALDKKALKRWTKWLFIVGIVGCVMTAAGMFIGMQGYAGDDAFGKGKFFRGDEVGGACPLLEEKSAKTGVVTPAIKPVVKLVK